MTICAYTPDHRRAFADLLSAYFPEVDGDIPEDIIRGKLLDLIEGQCRQGFAHVSLVLEAGEAAGFAIFQIDEAGSDWCKRPGWGFIREFYIRPEYRGRGFGRTLAGHCVQALRELGTRELYLTSEADDFWRACGWQSTGAVCSNGLPIFEKTE